MLYNILPHELYDEAEKSLRIIREDSRSMNVELILQNQRLLALSTRKPLCHGARYGLFEIHMKATAISIPHTAEIYITRMRRKAPAFRHGDIRRHQHCRARLQ